MSALLLTASALAFQLPSAAPPAAARAAVAMKAYSDKNVGDRKVVFNEQMGKGFSMDPRHVQIPMAAQTFVNEMLTSEGLAMNTPRYSYTRIFAVGYDSLCNVFLSAGINDQTADLVRESLCVAFDFKPKSVASDAADLLKLAEGKTEAEILELKDLKELAASDTQYSYTLGAGLIALMKVADVDPDEAAVIRWCEALNIKSVNSFKRDLGYFKMNVEKFTDLKEMFAQMKVSAKRKEAAKLKEEAEKAAKEADEAEKAEAA